MIALLCIFLLQNTSKGTSSEEGEAAEKQSEAESIAFVAQFIDADNRAVEVEEGKEITSTSLEFIDNNIEVFINHDKEVSEELVDTSIDYRHLGKDIDKHSGTMYQDQGVILDIQEVNSEGLNKEITIIHLQNPQNQTNYHLLYIGETDLLEDDAIQFIGLPLMNTSFSNVSGGTTKLFMILASDLEKIE
ncbi:hypothetical protein ACFSCZ_15135 [Siminovitchia sediminis]|uniref:Uncharacterized protein n=1 Tax=Siminovitchia sediminis TaxID=1274353 RepID=A0ABW4KP89_9BACI